VRAGFSCAANISWNPSIGVSDPGILTPILRPVATTSYQVVVSYGACVLRDTLKVLVTERDSLDCDNLLLPTAFSPNGDGLNDLFEISNPFLIDQLDNWTIFDRNGGIIFEGADPLVGWDGTFHDKALAPDYFGYRIEYQCKGETFQKVGSFYLMR